MPKFKRRQGEVVAVQFTRESRNEALEKAKGEEKLSQEEELLTMVGHQPQVGFFVETPHGVASISPQDYVVQKSEDDVYPIKEAEFLKLYDQVENEGEKKESPNPEAKSFYNK